MHINIEKLLINHMSGSLDNGIRDIVQALEGIESTSDLLKQESLFAEFRRHLIRSGRVDDLDLILNTAKQRAEVLNEFEPTELFNILMLNKHWHTGQLEKCQEIIDHSAHYTGEYSDLLRVFSAYYFNTSGEFDKSLHELDRIKLENIKDRKNVEHFLGVDLECVRATWRIWNRTETLNYNGIDEDLSYVDSVASNPDVISDKSSSLLFLATGVFYLSHNNYSRAKIFLDHAIGHAVGEGQAWLPRIQSALSVCEHKLGKFSLSAEFLDASVSNLGKHFGPSGWMIRVVQSLDLHDRHEEADILLSKIIEETERKGEKGYEVWSKIHLAEKGNFIGQSSLLFRMAERSGMRRACQYMLSNDLV